MESKLRYSDLITTIRIIVGALFAGLVSLSPGALGLWPGIVLILLIFNADSLDGWAARKFDKQSKYGAFYDIAGDRIIEIILLVPFVALQIASPLILIYFVVKGFLVDYQRLVAFGGDQSEPFKQKQNQLFKLLTASRPVRAGYGIAKTVMILMFYYLIFNQTQQVITIANVTAVLTVILSVLRTLPVYLK